MVVVNPWGSASKHLQQSWKKANIIARKIPSNCLNNKTKQTGIKQNKQNKQESNKPENNQKKKKNKTNRNQTNQTGIKQNKTKQTKQTNQTKQTKQTKQAKQTNKTNKTNKPNKTKQTTKQNKQNKRNKQESNESIKSNRNQTKQTNKQNKANRNQTNQKTTTNKKKKLWSVTRKGAHKPEFRLQDFATYLEKVVTNSLCVMITITTNQHQLKQPHVPRQVRLAWNEGKKWITTHVLHSSVKLGFVVSVSFHCQCKETEEQMGFVLRGNKRSILSTLLELIRNNNSPICKRLCCVWVLCICLSACCVDHKFRDAS